MREQSSLTCVRSVPEAQSSKASITFIGTYGLRIGTADLHMHRRSYQTQKGRGKRYVFPTVPEEPVPAYTDRVVACPRFSINMASQTEPVEQPPLSQPGLTEVLTAKAKCHESITSLATKVDAVQLDIGLIRLDMNKMRSRISSVEQRLSHTEDIVGEHTTELRTLHTKIRALEYKAEDAKNRNRRNNLHIIGLAEGVEGPHPTDFVEKFLRTLLPSAQFPPFYAVEREHCIPPKPGPPGSPPRTFILKFLNFRDRDEVLRAARIQGNLAHQNNKILTFPDYSVETQKLRRSFDQVKAAMRLKGIKYSVLFPARLRVQDGESTRFFTSPRDASWLDSLPPHC